MSRQSGRKAWLPAVGVGAGLFAGQAGLAADPPPPAPLAPAPAAKVAPAPLPPPQAPLDRVPPGGKVVQVKQPDQPLAPGAAPPTDLPPPVTPDIPRTNQTPPPVRNPDGPVTPISGGGGGQPPGRTDLLPQTQTGPGTNIPFAPQQLAPALNASDLGQALNRSTSGTGIQLQQRNALVTDPRIRGLRSYQYALYGDGAAFIPVRLDLDTPVTRFDPGAVFDVDAIKGPYSALYGPTLGALSVTTLNSPRNPDGFKAGGRTAFNYQTNGTRFNELQSVWAGAADWGVRLTYNGLQGNDYRDGSGQQVPSSYTSNNVNWAIGLGGPDDASNLEFKGLRVSQQNVEFPGLYFDVNSLDTEAYSLRYILADKDKAGPLDRVVLDVWYNSTVGTGDTRQGRKQDFVQKLLAVSFNPAAFPVGPDGVVSTGIPQAVRARQVGPPGTTQFDPSNPINLFTDQSTSRFAATSIGYRLFADWGSAESGRLTTGTDLRVLGQGLQENIRFTQISGRNLNTGELVTGPVPFGQFQSIPDSQSVNPGLYAEGELPVGDALRLKSGGRVDWNRSSTNIRRITGNVDLFGPPGPPFNPGRIEVDPADYSVDPVRGGAERARHFFLLAGYLQGEYRVTERITASMAVGHSERAPTLTELYASGPFVGVLQQGTSRLIGDAALKSEKLTQFDVGVRGEWEFLQAGVSGFYGWVHDYITFDQNRGGAGLTQVVFTNTDLATLAGGELFAQADLTEWLTGFGTLSYVQGVDQTVRDRRRRADLASSRRNDPATGQFAPETEPLPQIPPLESTVGLRVHQASEQPRWQVEFSARVVDGQNAVARTLDERPTPGYTVFNVRGYWQPQDWLLLTAGVENFGNKLYRNHLDPISGNILNSSPLFRPGTNFYFGSQLTY